MYLMRWILHPRKTNANQKCVCECGFEGNRMEWNGMNEQIYHFALFTHLSLFFVRRKNLNIFSWHIPISMGHTQRSRYILCCQFICVCWFFSLPLLLLLLLPLLSFGLLFMNVPISPAFIHFPDFCFCLGDAYFLPHLQVHFFFISGPK